MVESLYIKLYLRITYAYALAFSLMLAFAYEIKSVLFNLIVSSLSRMHSRDHCATISVCGWGTY